MYVRPENVIYVDVDATGTDDGSSWENAYPTLQAGLDDEDLDTGWEVWVAKANTAYTGNISLKSGVKLYGGFVGYVNAQNQGEVERGQRNWVTNETILDGNGDTTELRVVKCPENAVEGTRIDGFTITDGKYGTGAGIYCYKACLVIENNNITGNNAPNGKGGGIYIRYYSGQEVVKIINNVIENNDAQYMGGGIWCGANELSSYGSPEIRGNTITSNTADTEGEADFHEGGGICCEWLNAFVIAQNVFEGNSGGDHGGAIALHSCLEANKIENNLFVQNHCTGNAGQSLGGGAILSRDSKLDIVNNTFVQNWVGTGTWPNITLAQCGGAVHAWLCYSPSSPPQFRVTNNVFYDNRAAQDGEGVVQGRSVAISHSATADVRNCIAYLGNEAANYYRMPGGGQFNNGNPIPDCLYDDPDFCGTGAHPYWLDTQSPARGEGLDPGGTYYVPNVDIAGEPRPGDNETTDMGAYEDNDTCPQQ